MGLDEVFGQREIPIGDQHGGIAGSIEAVSPAAGFIDGERTLVVAAMQVAIGPHMVTRIDGVIQFCLQEDLDLLALLGFNGQHASTLSISRAICRQHATSRLGEQMDESGKVMPRATSTCPRRGHELFQP